MSAAQVIAEIQNLPREEQEVVIAFVERLQGEISADHKSIRYMDPAKAKATSEEIFKNHAELFRKLAQ